MNEICECIMNKLNEMVWWREKKRSAVGAGISGKLTKPRMNDCRKA